jgi:Methyltransferase domain
MTSYAFDNAWQQARQRLAAIEGSLDPGTTRHLSERGVGPGWQCIEVGAGGGSIAAWLCDRVGLTGGVLATDFDPRFVETLDRPNLQTQRHDICRDPLPTGAFDLVTRNGRRVAIVVSIQEWARKSNRQGNLAEFFAASPLRGAEIAVERTQDAPRRIELPLTPG